MTRFFFGALLCASLAMVRAAPGGGGGKPALSGDTQVGGYTLADLPERAPLTDATKGCFDGSYEGKFWNRIKDVQFTANGQKWSICHGTAADTNPYVFIDVDIHAAVEHLLGQGQGHGGANKRDDIFPMTNGDDGCLYDCNCDKVAAQVPSLSVGPISGLEDTTISFPLTATLNGFPGAERLDVWVSGIPAGATLSSGTRLEDGRYHLSEAEAASALSLSGLSEHSDVDFDVSVTARATLLCDETDYKASGAEYDADTKEWNDGAGADGVDYDGTFGVPEVATVSVIAVADEPTVSVDPATATLLEDTTLTATVAAALVDADGSESLSVECVVVPASAASCTATTDGQYDIVPTEHSDADFAVTWTATATETADDATPKTASASATLQVTMTAVADTPTITSAKASLTVLEDAAPFTVQVTSGLVDADGSESVSDSCSVKPASAATCAGADGSYTVTLTKDSDVDFELTFTATSTESAEDASPRTASATTAVAVRVTAVADAPTLTVAEKSYTIPEDATPFLVQADGALSDTDGSEVLDVVGQVNPESAATLTKTAAGYLVTPAAHSDRDFTIVFVATATEQSNGDSAWTQDSATVTVNAVADKPLLNAIDDFVIESGTPRALTPSGHLGDTDGSEVLSFTCTGPGTFNADCTSWTHDVGGAHTLTFTAVATERANGDATSSDPRTVSARVFVPPPPTPAGADVSDAFPSIGANVVDVVCTYTETINPLAGAVVTCPSSSCTLVVSCPHCSLNGGRGTFTVSGTAAELEAALNELTFAVERDQQGTSRETGWDADQSITVVVVDDESQRQASLKFIVNTPQYCEQGLSAYERSTGEGGLYQVREGAIVLHPWNDGHKLWICHSTGDGEGATLRNPYNLINVGWQSLGDGHFKMDACRPAECPKGTAPRNCPKTDYASCRKAFEERPLDAEPGHSGHSRPDLFIGDNMAATAAYAAIVGGGVQAGDLFRTTCGCGLTQGAVPTITKYEGTLSAGESLLVSVKCTQAAGCSLITSGNILVDAVLSSTQRRRLLVAEGSGIPIPQGETTVAVTVDQQKGYTPSTPVSLAVAETQSVALITDATPLSASAAAPFTVGVSTVTAVVVALVLLVVGICVGVVVMKYRRHLKKKALAEKNAAAERNAPAPVKVHKRNDSKDAWPTPVQKQTSISNRSTDQPSEDKLPTVRITTQQ